MGKTKKNRTKYKKTRKVLETEEEKTRYIQNLQQRKEETLKHEESDVQTFYDRIEQMILHSIPKKEEQANKKCILSEISRTLLRKRHDLQNKKPLLKEDKLELSTLYKKTNKQIKLDYKKHRLEIIEKHLNASGSLKRALTELNTKKHWIPKLKKGHACMNTRSEILATATDFYETLYKSRNTEIIPAEPYNFEDTTENPISNFNKKEIDLLLKKLKTRKSPGADGISNDMLKISNEALLDPLTVLFNKILREKLIPRQWAESDIVILYKKGDPTDIGNYRPISLMSSLYKIFSQGLQFRITPKVEEFLYVEQAGFRRSFSTIDHIHTIEQIIEKYQEFRRPLYLAFIDFKKAFDSIEHAAIWSALKQAKVNETYIEIIKNIYANCRSRVKLEATGKFIKIGRGVRQGDPLSTTLFITVLHSIIKELPWDNEGIKINEKNLTYLAFADDIVLLAEDVQKLQHMLNTLHDASKKRGLEMNLHKTQAMSNSAQKNLLIEATQLEYVQEYVYLGKQVSFKPTNNIEEIERRIAKTWKKFWSMKEVLKGPLPVWLKKRVVDSCLLPTLTYGSQTWTYTKEAKDKIAKCQRAIERSIMKIRLVDKIRHKEIRKKTKFIDAIEHALKMKWQWAGHVARMPKERWAYIATTWKGPKGKRRIGRPLSRWTDELKKILKSQDWTKVANDRDRWKELEEAFTREGS